MISPVLSYGILLRMTTMKINPQLVIYLARLGILFWKMKLRILSLNILNKLGITDIKEIKYSKIAIGGILS